MTDKELIQALRCCTSRPDCVFYLGNNVEGCVPDMGVTVSNRLEALLAENEHLREFTKMMPKWMSVSERLPKYNKDVLCYRPGMGMKIVVSSYDGYYGEDDCEWHEGWSNFGYDLDGNCLITHWQPLPEPPSTEGQSVTAASTTTTADS